MKEGDLVAGRYRLLRPIGAGGMGMVWAARHELLGRDLALKMASVADRGERERRDARDLFLREVRIVGRLRHPNVVEIADAGETGRDGLYLAMELLEGEPLARRLAAGPLTPAKALAVAAAVCCGLAAAHAAGVVHRDLKPENIFLARGHAGSVVPKLLDFGVSSACGVATLHREKLFGTPAYMSPEQALGERGTDHRTDLWALGVVLYEMLTGRLPFVAPSYPALLPLIIDAPYPPLPASIPGDVRTVVAGCLAKDPGDRYATAGALLEAIERAIDALPQADRAAQADLLAELTRSRGSTLPGFASEPSIVTPTLSGRTVRIGLAAAIFAVPFAIGVAALVSGVRALRVSDGAFSTGAPAPVVTAEPLVVGGSGTSGTGGAGAPAAVAAASASSPASPASPTSPAIPGMPASSRPASGAGAGRRSTTGRDMRVKPRASAEPAPRPPVTNVNNAGF